ncbi:hypothetical protein FB567DRAFT_469879 [Paraphoma chrysanthemicola]|uniref:Uncharacterized protein n=1 Tax=Paraphoma chrysanthemicola TaxID=798071 RepID=A0A8K0R8H8_9PLEO|nr:hypothetical protein FB567DRAFT_469879 [Paraphoma chrysanthemicola]
MPRPPTSPSPPPASFPFTAGNFDYPHASTSSSSTPRSQGSSSLSRALRSFTDRPERLSPSAQDVDDVPRRLPRPTRRGPMHRLFGPPRDSEAADNLLRRPPTANPNRPRAQPSERYLRRSSARISQARADMEAASDLLNSLSDIPLMFPSATTRARSPTVEVSSDRRQPKRRKLAHTSTKRPEHDGFKYGRKGQVVPGRLKMEVLSCDGGEYYDKDHPVGIHKVENVLKNDNSVYCSERSRCNLLLKHRGSASFALERIVIRAPDRGFTAPVQEGMIFVSMDAEQLLSSTSGYDLQYSSQLANMSPAPSSPADDEELSLREAIEDPYVWQHSRRGAQEDMEQRIENLRLRTQRHGREPWVHPELHQSQQPSTQDADGVSGDNCDYPGIIRVLAPTPPPFTVTTASDEEDSESESNEEPPSAAVMADRLRRESRWRAETDDEDEDIIPRFGGLRRARALEYTPYDEWRERRQRHTQPLRATQLDAPSRIEPSELSPEYNGLRPAHARFFIARNKSKMTIKFHPAISGRNVLLKLWSPTHDGNIDIESVQCYGFSGPRFFPAVQPC